MGQLRRALLRGPRTDDDVLVRRAGSASWRLAVTGSEFAVLALFVRDAIGLVVPSNGDAPPALDASVPDRRPALSDQDRADASEQWLPWWREILDFEAAVRRSLQSPDDRLRARLPADPPEFTALEHVPQLQAAVTASWDDASRWQQQRHSGRPDSDLGWDLIKKVVDDVAFDHHVPVDTLDGVLMVLPVTGLWWRRTAPRQVLCSEAVTTDSKASYQALYDVFASGVAS